VGSTTELVDRYVAVWNEPDPEYAARSSVSCGPRTGLRFFSRHGKWRRRPQGWVSSILRARGHDELECGSPVPRRVRVGGRFLFRRVAKALDFWMW